MKLKESNELRSKTELVHSPTYQLIEWSCITSWNCYFNIQRYV